MTDRIPLLESNYDGAEEQAVLEVLLSRWISTGQKAGVEAAFAGAHRRGARCGRRQLQQILPLITAGMALRYTNEIYVSPAVSEQVRARGVIDLADAVAPVVEDYGVSR
jgi:hypothetical protein